MEEESDTLLMHNKCNSVIVQPVKEKSLIINPLASPTSEVGA